MLEKWLGRPQSGESDSFLALLERATTALEKLAALKALELAAAGIATATFEEEGEILETDPEALELQEQQAERILKDGLAPNHNFSPLQPDGRGWPAPEKVYNSGSPFGGGWSSFPLGPEGAEAPTHDSKE